jgi:hypothetical protein
METTAMEHQQESYLLKVNEEASQDFLGFGARFQPFGLRKHGP